MGWELCEMCNEPGASSRAPLNGRMAWVHLSCYANPETAKMPSNTEADKEEP